MARRMKVHKSHFPTQFFFNPSLLLLFPFVTHSPRDHVPPGKISAQPHIIIKQSRIPKVHQLCLVLFSSSKNCMPNEVCNWMEILPPCHPTNILKIVDKTGGQTSTIKDQPRSTAES